MSALGGAFLFLVCAAILLRVRAASSRGSSLVTNALHVIRMNFRKICPRSVVVSSRCASVVSVCKRSLALACQVARTKRRSVTSASCGAGRSPSKTGMAHYVAQLKFKLKNGNDQC